MIEFYLFTTAKVLLAFFVLCLVCKHIRISTRARKTSFGYWEVFKPRVTYTAFFQQFGYWYVIRGKLLFKVPFMNIGVFFIYGEWSAE
jgi:hypothetical protein